MFSILFKFSKTKRVLKRTIYLKVCDGCDCSHDVGGLTYVWSLICRMNTFNSDTFAWNDLDFCQIYFSVIPTPMDVRVRISCNLWQKIWILYSVISLMLWSLHTWQGNIISSPAKAIVSEGLVKNEGGSENKDLVQWQIYKDLLNW